MTLIAFTERSRRQRLGFPIVMEGYWSYRTLCHCGPWSGRQFQELLTFSRFFVVFFFFLFFSSPWEKWPLGAQRIDITCPASFTLFRFISTHFQDVTENDVLHLFSTDFPSPFSGSSNRGIFKEVGGCWSLGRFVYFSLLFHPLPCFSYFSIYIYSLFSPLIRERVCARVNNVVVVK